MSSIAVTLTHAPREKPSPDNLGFGNYFTDHMFLMDYASAKGWHNARIVPYSPLPLDPASMVLHYGQEVFEGLKAYGAADGSLRLFRACDNIRRFNRSCERLGAPPIDEALFMEAILLLLRTDADWSPHKPDASLYIRPFLIATDAFLGVRSSDSYLFVIILSPVGAYYATGMSPTNILVEDEDVRAVRGGLGYAKTGANYAATIRSQERAKLKGFTQVLWLDALERRYIEEIGTSNAFFVINGTALTPPLGGSILPGITRDSCLRLLEYWGVPARETPLTIDEVISACESGRLEEAFASGTAAVISPVGSLTYKDTTVTINNGEVGPLAWRLYDTLTAMQRGAEDDIFGWVSKV
ncbi:MAG: branched-chain amino acid aminotransferase [Oscillospiraceae bacterium]|jgi:branched-chain amino acid aminotransferase|nr:branched-chain amino acid aminotransferase [Oscillospiraceae bacterium]